MNSPRDFQEKAHKYAEDIDSLIAIYREIGAIINAYGEVKKEILTNAEGLMQSDGVIHHKHKTGSAGWTKPKALKLDKAKWAAVIDQDDSLRQLQREADRINRELEQAQEHTGCMAAGPSRFYIR